MRRFQDRSEPISAAGRAGNVLIRPLSGICILLLMAALCSLLSVEGYGAQENELFDCELEFDRYREAGDVIYASGSDPVFTWNGAEDGKAFLQLQTLSPVKELKTLEVDEGFSLTLEEGEYILLPYLDGSPALEGNDTGDMFMYPPDYPRHIVYDNTPPEPLDFRIEAHGSGYTDPDRDDYQLFASDDVTISILGGEDALSGRETVFVTCDGVKYETDSIVMKRDGGEIHSLEAYCVDKCGNAGDIYVLNVPRTIIDRQEPEVRLDSDEDDGSVIFDIDMEDKGSGLGIAEVSWNDEPVKTRDYLREHRRYETGELSVRIDEGDIEGDKRNELRVRVWDSCKNCRTVLAYVRRRRDEKAPEIFITGVRDGEILRGYAALRVDICDEDIDKDGVVMQYVREDSEGGVRTSLLDSSDTLVFQQDGRYTFIVTARDKSGNESEGRIGFVIDNTPPRIRGLEKYRDRILDELCLEEDIGQMFIDDTVVLYRLYLNGMDFSEYEKVEEPGDYIIEILATDQAGNSTQESAGFTIRGEEYGESEQAVTKDDGSVEYDNTVYISQNNSGTRDIRSRDIGGSVSDDKAGPGQRPEQRPEFKEAETPVQKHGFWGYISVITVLAAGIIWYRKKNKVIVEKG